MNRTVKFLIIAILIFVPVILKAQHTISTKGKTFLGAGVGLPFGGYGGRFSVNPGDQFTLFGGAGYNLVGLAANGGFQYSIPSQKQTEFYFTGMYGYNSIILLKGASEYDKTYSGLSLGAGIKISSFIYQGYYWDIGVLAPIRPNSYKEDLQSIKKNPYMTIYSEPWPILFYVSYNIMLSKKIIN